MTASTAAWPRFLRDWPVAAQRLQMQEAPRAERLAVLARIQGCDLNGALVGLDIRDLIRVLPGKHYARRI